MAIHYRTQGFILKKEDKGETDQLFTAYTKDFGKLEILGRAIRKIKSKLRSAIWPFCLSEIEFIQGKTHKTLTDAILVEKFENLRKDLKKTTIAHQVSEILDNLTGKEEKDEKIWELLIETFQKLNKRPFTPAYYSLIYYYFFWKILSLLGYKIELQNCVFCQKKLEPKNLFFSSKEGGIICNSCQNLVKLARKIEPDTVKILRILTQKDWEIVKKLKITKVHLKDLKEVSKIYYSFLKAELND